MKPNPQIAPLRQTPRREPRAMKKAGFPHTDCNYQPTQETRGGSTTLPTRVVTPDVRMFRKISSEFFGSETSRIHVAEGLYFTVIIGLAAWPIGDMLSVLADWMQ